LLSLLVKTKKIYSSLQDLHKIGISKSFKKKEKNSMFRKISLVLSFIMIATLLLSACGGTATEAPEVTEESAPAQTEEAVPEETEEAASNEGTIQMAGSTTVQPLAEVLGEAYMEMHPGVVIEVQGGGSSVGVTSAGECTTPIGNASRTVKDSEFEEFPGITAYVIANDGIAIVTNPEIEIPTLSVEQVRDIFAGEIANFSEVGGSDAPITVVAREEGSGTRAAFEELVMEYKDDAGEKQSKLIVENALLQQSNGQVRTTVATTPNTVAFLSFGFLDDSTYGVPIDGVLPDEANVVNGTYPIYRPLNMITNSDCESALANDFIQWILSDEGQAIVKAEEYIPVGGVVAEEPAEPVVEETEEVAALEGTLQMAGSTTVQPLAEVLGEVFMEMYPDVVIEVQGGGSSVGVTSAGECTTPIGNASRTVKDSEFEEFPGITAYVIANDGIAIVTNPEIEIPTLSVEQVRDIFAGEITNFSEVGGPDAPITVVAREEGSGTRAAFEELVMEYKDDAGEKQSKLIVENALLQQSNGQVRTTVTTTPNTVAFLSFGFLDDSTYGVPIDGVLPDEANVVNGTYPIYRPLNMITNSECESELANTFIEYILSEEGQAIVKDEEYIPVGSAPEAETTPASDYVPPTGLSGQLQLAGSTTVQPLAEVLGEAFMEFNPDLVIEIQGGGSSVGVTSAGECTTPIGNASRTVKDSEFEEFPGITAYVIANDGIAIVTNPEIEIPTLSVEQVRDIFAGEITNFSEVGGPDAPITVVAREEGSGTRAAFEELVMEYKDDAGEKQSKLIVESALLQQSNGQVRTTVATTPNTIAFLSFGFLDDSTYGVPIDGVVPMVENVMNGTYPIFRPLNMITNSDCPDPNADAFIEYILSALGQEIVAEDYIPLK
jgi:phosphate transport system substrate-binding protein